jgi:hypothetical protein
LHNWVFFLLFFFFFFPGLATVSLSQPRRAARVALAATVSKERRDEAARNLVSVSKRVPSIAGFLPHLRYATLLRALW